MSEISQSDNLRRLSAILYSHCFIVLCGNKAMEAFERMQLTYPMTHDAEVLRIAHPGARGLNSVRKGHGLTHQQKLRLLARVIAGVPETAPT